MAENAIDSAGRGVPIILGGRFTLYARDGEIDGLAQFTVRDADGRRQTQQQKPVSELVSEDGAYQYEQAVVVDTSGWEIGTYTVEMIAQDRQTGYVSDPVTAEFRLLSPLTEAQAALESVETPGRVQVGEPYQFTLTVANRSAEANSIRSSLSARTELSDWFTYSNGDKLVELTIPAGGTNTWQSGETAFNQAGEFTFRLDAVGGTWTVTVTES